MKKRTPKYVIVIEKGPRSYGAFVPDLPGCVAVATSAREVRRLIREAIELHMTDMVERGERLPKPVAAIEYFNSAPRRRRTAA